MAAAAVVGVAGATQVAHAALVTASSARLGAGTTAVGTCGSLANLGYSVVNSTGSVTSVTVTGMPSSCNNASLRLAVSNGGVLQGSGGPVTITKGSATVPVSPSVPNASVGDLRILVTGP